MQGSDPVRWDVGTETEARPVNQPVRSRLASLEQQLSIARESEYLVLVLTESRPLRSFETG